MTRDPLLELRLDVEPVDPDPVFRTALRGRIERALNDPNGDPMSTPVVPARPRTMTPYLCCRDARAAIDWYRDAFGAELVGETYPMGPDDDRVGHAELRLGPNRFFLSDEWAEGDVYSPETRGGPTTSFVLEVSDVDRVYDHATSLGATVVQPVADQPYGMRAGWLLDPFGHRWSLGSPLPGAGHEQSSPVFAAEDLYDEIGYYVLGRSDLGAAKAFYAGVFGWTYADEQPTPGGGRGAHVTSSLVPFGLSDDPVIGSWHPWFRVRDLAATLERVRAAGGEVLETNEYASGGGARCRDDQGVEFEVYQPAPGY